MYGCVDKRCRKEEQHSLRAKQRPTMEAHFVLLEEDHIGKRLSIRRLFLNRLVSRFRRANSLASEADTHNPLDDESFFGIITIHIRRPLIVNTLNADNDDSHQALLQTKTKQTTASIPVTPVTGEDDKDALLPRPTSSVYSRDIDGNSIRSRQSLHTMPSSRRTSSFRHRSLTSCSPVSHIKRFSSSSRAESASVSSASDQDKVPVSRLFAIIMARLRTSSMFSRSSIGGDDAASPAENNENATEEIQIGLRTATQQHQRIMRITTLGRLRRRVNSVDFDSEDMLMVKSDLTTLVPVSQQGGAGGSQTRVPVADHDFFRERLARLVHRRLATLRLEGREGSYRALEDWYSEVVDLIGWSDQSEADLEWGWRKNDGFF